MTDAQLWRRGAEALRRDFGMLSPSLRQAVEEASLRMRRLKAGLQRVAGGAAVADICRACGGQCCRSGKYHVSVADLLVLVAAGNDVFSPSFGAGACPFLGAGGCLMDEEFRPLPCIIFICEAIADTLPADALAAFAAGEERLRAIYYELERLLEKPVRRAMLLHLEAAPAGVPSFF